MVKDDSGTGAKKALLPLLVVPAGGLLVLGALYVGYVGVFMFFETVVYGANPNLMPVGMIRNGYALSLLLILVFLLATRLPEIIKAIFLLGALGVAMIAMILRFYMNLPIAIIAVALLAVTAGGIMIFRKGPWYDYYAIGLAAAAAVYYAWPE